MRKQEKRGVVIYQAKSGAIELRGDFGKETMWASLDQIADLFGRDKSVISRHIKNIFKDDELQRDSVVAFFATTADDGKTYNVEYFDLDMILSVGYRVNSAKATQFRIWATERLKEYIIKGFTMDDERLKNPDTLFGKDYFEEQLAMVHSWSVILVRQLVGKLRRESRLHICSNRI